MSDERIELLTSFGIADSPSTILPPSGPKIPKESRDSHVTCCDAPFLSLIHWTKGARTLFYKGKSSHDDPFASDPKGETLDIFEFLARVLKDPGASAPRNA